MPTIPGYLACCAALEMVLPLAALQLLAAIHVAQIVDRI